MFLVIMNEQTPTVITDSIYFKNMMLVILLPAIFLLLISVLVTTIILKKTLKSLDLALVKLN